MVTKRVYVLPPPSLVQMCQVGNYNGETNMELLEWTAASIKILSDCSRINYKAYQKWLEDNK